MRPMEAAFRSGSGIRFAITRLSSFVCWLRLNFNDVPPHGFCSLLPFRHKVLPDFRLEKRSGGVGTLPLGHGYANGRGLALCVENPAFQGAHRATARIG